MPTRTRTSSVVDPRAREQFTLHGDGSIDGRAWGLEDCEELVGASLDLVPAGRHDRAAQHRPHLVDQLAVALAEPVHECRRPLDVGHQHRDEARGQLDRLIVGVPERPLGLQLAGDEADRHDLELLGRVEQPQACSLAGFLALERRPG